MAARAPVEAGNAGWRHGAGEPVNHDTAGCLRYANRSSKFGSEAKLHIWQGMAHVFPANLALLEAAREALDIAGEFLHRNLAR
jgi:hypothetical protein